jgi:hypothetical protein
LVFGSVVLFVPWAKERIGCCALGRTAAALLAGPPFVVAL